MLKKVSIITCLYTVQNLEPIATHSDVNCQIFGWSFAPNRFTGSGMAKLYCTLYCTVHCTVLYILLYCTVLYCTVLYCTVLYCTVLYCTVLYFTVPYCIVFLLQPTCNNSYVWTMAMGCYCTSLANTPFKKKIRKNK